MLRGLATKKCPHFQYKQTNLWKNEWPLHFYSTVQSYRADRYEFAGAGKQKIVFHFQ